LVGRNTGRFSVATKGGKSTNTSYEMNQRSAKTRQSSSLMPGDEKISHLAYLILAACKPMFIACGIANARIHRTRF